MHIAVHSAAKEDAQKKGQSTDQVAELVGAPSYTPKGCGFDPQSGHIPRLQFDPWLGHVREAME